jgi:hypothetical protein
MCAVFGLRLPCGVPAQALCTEASLAALRRTYPQIYASDEKLLIDPARVAVAPRDFLAAHAAMTPASHRSATAHARCASLLACWAHEQARAGGSLLAHWIPPLPLCLLGT